MAYLNMRNFMIGFLTISLFIGIGLPLLTIFYYAFFEDGAIAVSQLIELYQDPKMFLVIRNSIRLGIYVVLGTTCLALPLAFIMTRTSLRHHRWLQIIFLIPFMTPPYIGAMGWILFMQEGGFAQQLFPLITPWTSSFFSLSGMVFMMSLHLFPFLYLMLYNALLRIQGNYQQAATIYGKSKRYNLFKVTFPLLFASYLLGILLIFVKTLAEFGTPATFGKRIGYPVFTTEIHGLLSTWPIRIQFAVGMSLVLLFICLVVWGIQSYIQQKVTYTTISGRTVIPVFLKESRFITLISKSYVFILLFFAIGIPYFSIMSVSLMKVRGDGLNWNNITLKNYFDLVQTGSKGFQAFNHSLQFALIASCITIIFGLCIVLLTPYLPKVFAQLIDFISLIPNTIPGIVMVVGLMMFWNSPLLPLTIYNTKWMPIVTYAVLFLPYAVQYIKSAYQQLDRSLFEAAEIFSAHRLKTLWRITFPLLIPGILAGWMMTFIISMRELVASLLILPPSVQTIATYIYAQFEQGDVGMGMAMAVVTVVITIVVISLMEYLKRKGEFM